MPKATDRIKALQQQRAAALAPEAPAMEALAAPSNERAADVAAVQAHFGGALEGLVRGRAVERIPVSDIAPEVRPEARQPRLLPLPHELLPDGQPAPRYAGLVAELLALGESLQARQIQPIIVYPGASDASPAARYLILVGQRRWTAACLVGMKMLDALVVSPPTTSERVRLQYIENEAREEFSDMERAWALVQMKQALGDAPWEEVEQRLQLSRARRHQLIRLLAFTPTQQHELARLRLQETQVRTLHTALRSGQLARDQVDAVLRQLAKIADARAAAGEAGAQRAGIDGPTVARQVARAKRAALGQAPMPRWLPLLEAQLTRTRQALERAQGRAALLSDADVGALLEGLVSLRDDIERLAAVVRARQAGGASDAHNS
ncbi:MAG TPA: ParB N-terminal domain-containing protein [Rhodocyclaceae bacterium]|nr:ParB N-terminal domain-containing protein [Rhodocyclaceae bacterium]